MIIKKNVKYIMTKLSTKYKRHFGAYINDFS